MFLGGYRRVFCRSLAACSGGYCGPSRGFINRVLLARRPVLWLLGWSFVLDRVASVGALLAGPWSLGWWTVFSIAVLWAGRLALVPGPSSIGVAHRGLLFFVHRSAGRPRVLFSTVPAGRLAPCSGPGSSGASARASAFFWPRSAGRPGSSGLAAPCSSGPSASYVFVGLVDCYFLFLKEKKVTKEKNASVSYRWIYYVYHDPFRGSVVHSVLSTITKRCEVSL